MVNRVKGIAKDYKTAQIVTEKGTNVPLTGHLCLFVSLKCVYEKHTSTLWFGFDMSPFYCILILTIK